MPNPVVSFEIRCRDTDAMRAFYAALFDWQIDPLPGGAPIPRGRIRNRKNLCRPDERSRIPVCVIA